MPYRGEPGSSTDGTTPLILGCFGGVALLIAGGILAFMLLRGGRTSAIAPISTPVPAVPSPPPPPLPVSAPEPEPEPAVPVAPEAPPAETESAIPRDAIRRVVRRHLPEVTRCYEHALETSPDLRARVVASITIDATGAVRDATIADSPDPELETCLAARIRTWTFPAPEGGGVVLVHYPFVLEPG